jgi:hypothetical protein
MRCIWEGDLRSILDNVKLCVIIENLHFWAMNHLRPWLSSCVDQWRRSIAEIMNVDDVESDSAESDSAESDSSLNFAFRRAATLDDFLNQEEEDVHDDDSYKNSDEESSEEEDEDGEEEYDEDEDDEYDDDDDDDDEETEEYMEEVCKACGSVY